MSLRRVLEITNQTSNLSRVRMEVSEVLEWAPFERDLRNKIIVCGFCVLNVSIYPSVGDVDAVWHVNQVSTDADPTGLGPQKSSEEINCKIWAQISYVFGL